MIRITLYSGPSDTDDRPGDVSVRDCNDRDVTEELRQIGLEWKTADYMNQRQVVITLDPIPPGAGQLHSVKAAARQAIERLESALDA